MPRYSKPNRYQVGDYWLAKRAGSPAWQRTWFDARARQTRRISLGTTDFEEAKERLNDWFVLEHAKKDEPADSASLAEIFARFYENHGKHLASEADIRRVLRYWLEFHGEATVKEATERETQAKFRDWLTQNKGLGLSSVRNALATGKSALNWAWKRGELAEIPHVPLVIAPKAEPKGRPLEIEEAAKLFEVCEEPHVLTLMAFMLGTAARTGAILDMTLRQIDLKRDLIDLNPPGRIQTKKHRPTVKLPNQLKDYAEARSQDGRKAPLVSYDGRPVAEVKRSWRTVRDRAALPGNVQTYSFRHTMARWLRMKSVPGWEVAAQLGHKASEFSTTEIYAPFDPAYLSQSLAAIDDFLGQIACHLRANSMSDVLLNTA